MLEEFFVIWQKHHLHIPSAKLPYLKKGTFYIGIKFFKMLPPTEQRLSFPASRLAAQNSPQSNPPLQPHVQFSLCVALEPLGIHVSVSPSR
jgi:hypothetical protein